MICVCFSFKEYLGLIEATFPHIGSSSCFPTNSICALKGSETSDTSEGNHTLFVLVYSVPVYGMIC